LKDGTRHEETGRGRANQFPVKAMALNKSKKESVTNGIKTSIESLCYILLMHESRLRSGYYAHDADDDIFSYK
jgi:recombination DNA repair RAD52 pathway protein